MRLLKFLVAAPVAALILAFAFANREWVTVNFDPVGGHGLEPVQARQYVVLLVVAGLGVVAGSVTTWIGQGRHRRALREAEAEAARLRQELQSQRIPALTRQA
jgi:membrane protein YqaA with SNARE-associated domain